VAELAMFPLGAVLFPSLSLPLHVFEPRYRVLVRHCLDTVPEFGVVLIERGNEVGGGDLRSMVGTVARIVEAGALDDGRWVLSTVGTRRIRVTQWLPDDPYPRADVEDWPDADANTTAGEPDAARRAATQSLRRVLGLRAELAEPSPPATVDIADDPVLASYQLAALAPVGPADQQALLAVPGAAARLDDLTRMLDDEARFLTQRLELG
jgi:Lon protease-like protein